MKEGRQKSGVSPEQPATGAAVLCPSPPGKKKASSKVGEEEAPGGGAVAQLHSGSGRAALAGQCFILGEGHVMPGEEGDTETLSFCPRGQSQGFPSPSPRPGKSERPADALLTVTVGASWGTPGAEGGQQKGCG